MKITLQETTKQDREFDVEFPIYREHDVTPDVAPFNTIIYTRIEDTGDNSVITSQRILKAVYITISGGHCVDIEIKERYKFDSSNIDYLLGKGEYKSSKQSFDNALRKVQELIDSIRPI